MNFIPSTFYKEVDFAVPPLTKTSPEIVIETVAALHQIIAVGGMLPILVPPALRPLGPALFVGAAQALDNGFTVAPNVEAQSPGVVADFDEVLHKGSVLLYFEAVRSTKQGGFAAHLPSVVQYDFLRQQIVAEGDLVAVYINRKDFHSGIIMMTVLR